MKKYDVVIIWAWAAWFSAAGELDKIWKTYVIIWEKETFWWICPSLWCSPKKIGYKISNEILACKKYDENFEVDYEKVFKERFSFIWNYWEKYIKSLEKGDRNFLVWSAKFLNKNEVIVKLDNWEEEIVYGEKIIISTGSSAINMTDNWMDNAINSNDFFALEKFPKEKDIVFIWSGFISVELAFQAAMFWWKSQKVYIIWRSKTFLKTFDQSLVKILEKDLNNKWIFFIRNVTDISIEKISDDNFVLKTNNADFSEMNASLIIQAIWRKPNTNLDLEKVEVEFSKRGIWVNDFLETNIDNIFAIWDVNWLAQFTPYASLQWKVAVQNMFWKEQSKIQKTLPSNVYSSLVLSTYWESEKSAKDKAIEIKVESVITENSLYYKTHYGIDGLWFKFIFNEKSKKLIWFHSAWLSESCIYYFI